MNTPESKYKTVRMKELSDLIQRFNEQEKLRLKAENEIKALIELSEKKFGIYCGDDVEDAETVIAALYREIGFEFLHGDRDV